MIYLLDTDILTFLLREGSAERARVQERIVELPANDVVQTTVINYEEQVRGWMTVLGRARSLIDEVRAYDRLLKQVEFFKEFTILPYDSAAANIFEDLRTRRIRIGAMDLKIAAIALSRDATLITRNSKDFRRVPNLPIEDWLID